MGKMKAELLVSGGIDFNPDLLQDIVGLKPDCIIRMGDQIGTSWRRYDDNIWLLTTGYSEWRNLSECLSALIERTEPNWDKFCNFIPSGCEVQLSVVVNLDGDGFVPILNLDSNMVEKLAGLHASIDFDIIISGK